MDNSILANIIKNGKYYNPASTRYDSNTIVSCDRCFNNNLNICVGWRQYDLCMKCFRDVTNIKPSAKIKKK